MKILKLLTSLAMACIFTFMLSTTAFATDTAPLFDLASLQSLVSEFWWTIILAVIGIFSIIAMFLPAPAPNGSKFYTTLYYFCQWCAANVLHARNAQDTSPRLILKK